MTQISLLQSTLNHLPWHGAQLDFLAQLLIALFHIEPINLAEVASACIRPAQRDSCYKRLQRFFRHFEIDYQQACRYSNSHLESIQLNFCGIAVSAVRFSQSAGKMFQSIGRQDAYPTRHAVV